MASKIRWTIKATNDLESVVNYLETEWSRKVKQNFLRILSSKLNLISIFPALGPQIFPIQKIRAILITKHTRMYYRVDKNALTILRIYDTRKDPQKFQL